MIDVQSAERETPRHADLVDERIVLSYFLIALGMAHSAASLVGMAFVVGVRLASIVFRLQLPVFVLEGDGVPADRNRTP